MIPGIQFNVGTMYCAYSLEAKVLGGLPCMLLQE